jgi:hypothetical protein
MRNQRRLTRNLVLPPIFAAIFLCASALQSRAGLIVYSFSGTLTGAFGPNGTLLPGFSGSSGQPYTGVFSINDDASLVRPGVVETFYNDPNATFSIDFGGATYQFVTYHSAVPPSSDNLSIRLDLFQGTPSSLTLGFQSSNYTSTTSNNHDFSQVDFQIVGGPTTITSVALPGLTIGPIGGGNFYLGNSYFDYNKGVITTNYNLTGTVTEVTRLADSPSVPEPSSFTLLLGGVSIGAAGRALKRRFA